MNESPPNEKPSKEDLAIQRQDYIGAAVRGVLGATPFVGNLLAELVGTVIPNQRADRLARFAIELEARLESLEDVALEQLRTNEHFSELLEEGLHQAARSVTDDRRRYIASLIASSLSRESITHQESRHLLRILGELDDIEIIWLRFYVDQAHGGDREFRETHRDVLRAASRSQGQPQSEVDRAALQDSYTNHLTQLALLEVHIGRSGMRTHRITALGRLLLREIGLKWRRDQ